MPQKRNRRRFGQSNSLPVQTFYYADVKSSIYISTGCARSEENARVNACEHMERNKHKWALIMDRGTSRVLWTLIWNEYGITRIRGDASLIKKARKEAEKVINLSHYRRA
jgi:hypothetical protein